jgi:hypothetical protein
MTQATRNASTVYLRAELADLLTELRSTDLTADELRELVAVLTRRDVGCAPAR